MINLINQTEAIKFLLNENVVALPTETVYGLAGLATSKKAVETIFKIKNRPVDNPLICHFHSLDQVLEYAKIEYDYLFELLKHFWPGGLTVLLPTKNRLLKPANLGQDRVACRVPNNAIFLDIIRGLNIPLAAPSANLSTRPSCTNANQVIKQFGEVFDESGNYAENIKQFLKEKGFGGEFEMAVVDGGESQIGLESTIILPSESQIKILRPGWIGKSEIEGFLKKSGFNIEIIEKAVSAQVIPGAKYKHYSPKTKILKFYKKELCEVDFFDISQNIIAELENHKKTEIETIANQINAHTLEYFQKGELKTVENQVRKTNQSKKTKNQANRFYKIGIWNMLQNKDFQSAGSFRDIKEALEKAKSMNETKEITSSHFLISQIFDRYSFDNLELLSHNFYKSLNEIDEKDFDMVILLLPESIKTSQDSKTQALNNKIEKL